MFLSIRANTKDLSSSWDILSSALSSLPLRLFIIFFYWVYWIVFLISVWYLLNLSLFARFFLSIWGIDFYLNIFSVCLLSNPVIHFSLIFMHFLQSLVSSHSCIEDFLRSFQGVTMSSLFLFVIYMFCLSLAISGSIWFSLTGFIFNVYLWVLEWLFLQWISRDVCWVAPAYYGQCS